MLSEEEDDGRSKPVLESVAIGAAAGLLPAIPALAVAFASAGFGHGDYIAMRALFPVPTLLGLAEDSVIKLVALGLGFAQFPLYGALLGWTLVRKSYLSALLVGALHITATVLCFTAANSHFS